MFEHLNSILPLDRLYESPLLLAYYHPEPVYPIHILIVPKKTIRDVLDLAERSDEYRLELLEEVLRCVRELVLKMHLEEVGYRIIVNGGSYQKVGELHFHLVSGEIPARHE